MNELRTTPFIITIDTEGDDLWSQPREITTRNAAALPRFQALCERFGFKPVYLTNYEMAMSDAFVEFGRDAVARGAAEIGMHLHAWNSPPLVPLTEDDYRYQPYLIEYPDEVMREKIRTMTRLLEERFGQPVVSHRAGRWGFDGRYARLLVAEGYRVDCSVTPGVDWRGNGGAPGGIGGTDYTRFPAHPYFFSADDIASPARGPLLEVPMTVRRSRLDRLLPFAYRTPLVRRAANRAAPSPSWLCAVQPALRAGIRRHLDAMLRMARLLRAEKPPHVEFMLHSSEFMPGTNPIFRSAQDIEHLYEGLTALFGELAAWCHGETLKSYWEHAAKSQPASVAELTMGST